MIILEFKEVPDNGRRTMSWDVSNRRFGVSLGNVSWFARWKCFCFFPEREGMAFDAQCLRDIAQFCDDETTKRRGSKKPNLEHPFDVDLGPLEIRKPARKLPMSAIDREIAERYDKAGKL